MQEQDKTYPVSSQNKDQEIDLIEIARKLWYKRKFILGVVLVFMGLGVLVAVFSAEEYTASCTMVPQTTEKMTSGGLSSLAAMAGVNLGDIERGEVLSPKIYPKILASVPFQKELMQTKIQIQDYPESVRLLDYYTDEKYEQTSWIGAVLKYTVGLPGVILSSFQSEEDPVVSWPVQESGARIETVSFKEDLCRKKLQECVSLTLNEKEGYVTLLVKMPEPLAAAQLAAEVQALLQRYITEFKIEKAKANLEFVEGRYQEAKHEYELKQQELAAFRDANRSFASAVAKTTEERLTNEYDLLFSVYSELAKQREKAGIQVKENTPVFAIVDPVTVPTERSKPKRALILVGFTFFGAFVGVGLALILPFLVQLTGSKRLSKWLTEEEKRGL